MRLILWILWLESLKTKRRWIVLKICYRFHASLFDFPIAETKLHVQKFPWCPPADVSRLNSPPIFCQFPIFSWNNMRVYELIWHWARRSSGNVCPDPCCRDTNESAMGATSPRRVGPWSRLQGLLLSVRDHRYFKSKKSPKKPPKRRHLPMPSRSSRSSSSRADDSDEALEKGMEMMEMMEMEDKNAATDMPELPMLQSNVRCHDGCVNLEGGRVSRQSQCWNFWIASADVKMVMLQPWYRTCNEGNEEVMWSE